MHHYYAVIDGRLSKPRILSVQLSLDKLLSHLQPFNHTLHYFKQLRLCSLLLSLIRLIHFQVSYCDIYSIDEAKLSYEYLAFASQKKLTSAAPTLAIVETFEKELSKISKAMLENVTSSTMYDSSTLPLADVSMEITDLVNEAYSGGKCHSVVKQLIDWSPNSSLQIPKWL